LKDCGGKLQLVIGRISEKWDKVAQTGVRRSPSVLFAHTGALVEFGVLGPVEVRVGGRAADTGHPRQRAVLAVLLLGLGRVVPPEVLIDRVWGEAPPTSVRNVLSGYVARLRAVMAAAAEARGHRAVLTWPPLLCRETIVACVRRRESAGPVRDDDLVIRHVRPRRSCLTGAVTGLG
jgi:hypothetical protein